MSSFGLFCFVFFLYRASDPYVFDIKQVNTIYMNIYIYELFIVTIVIMTDEKANRTTLERKDNTKDNNRRGCLLWSKLKS